MVEARQRSSNAALDTQHLDPATTVVSKFDEYATDYQALHRSSVATSGEDPDYFARYKLACLRRLGAQGPLLDYGCGIGNLTTHLAVEYPDVHGFDPSAASLTVARERAPTAHFWEPERPPQKRYFATVVLAGVLHHVAPKDRNRLLRDAYEFLKPKGRLVVFEHNPLNPLTRKAVRDCPFDDDAILLFPDELRRRVADAGFTQVQVSYIVFFPRAFARLRRWEPHLRRCFLGAQTMTVAGRPS